MEFLQLAKRRCSVRAYEARAVEPEVARAIVEAGRVAPTAANRQPVRVVQVDTPEGLEKLARGAEVYGAPLAFVVCVDHAKAWKRSYDGKSTADIDASIVADHMMMEATDLGLGSVWICWFDPEVIAREFSLPEGIEPVNILAVGHPGCALSSSDRHAVERIAAHEFLLAR